MLTRTLAHRLFRNAHLKIISLCIGYGFWLLLSQSHYATIERRIPLCVYNAPATLQLDHPESVDVVLAGKKADLRMLDLHTLAIHIDGSALKRGKNAVSINAATLLLPEWIGVTRSYPANVSISAT